MEPGQIERVEGLVNAAIRRDYPVCFEEMTVDKARETGAIGLFEVKYGAKIKVYTIGDPAHRPAADPVLPTFSKEICGGPHVERTGLLGRFRIIKEQNAPARASAGIWFAGCSAGCKNREK